MVSQMNANINSENLALDPFCFMFNTIAMGDVIASVPVVKYMVNRYFPDHKNYKVVVKSAFKPLFPFVPESNFLDFDQKENMWGIPEDHAIGPINKKKEPRIVRLTPKHMHLSQFASLQLADRIIPLHELNYVALDAVDISKFGVDFSKAVILITSYRDVTRMWHAEYILQVAAWLKSKGLIPVFVGKTDMDLEARASIIPKTSLAADVSEHGVDLRNKTSIAELASIMSASMAVCGIDSGPVHLAGTTHTPVVCGYTSVSSENRIPVREHGVTIAIEPNLSCIGCESKWHSTYWNFENCYHKHAACCANMTADKFIHALQSLEAFRELG